MKRTKNQILSCGAKLLAILALVGLSFGATANVQVGIYAKNEGRYDVALQVFRPLVKLGYGAAQYEMAQMYEDGLGLKKDMKAAIDLYRKAAVQGYAGAQFKLSRVYIEGKLAPVDVKESMKWLKKAANLGLTAAEFNLAVAYHDGELINVDYKKAFYWYKEAAFKNYVLAQYNLALMYAEGYGTKRDHKMSYVWNFIANQNGYKDAGRSLNIDRRVLTVDETKAARYKVKEVLRQIESKRTDLTR